MADPQKKSIQQLIQEAEARGEDSIEVPPGQEAEMEQWLKLHHPQRSPESFAVEAPTDPVQQLVDEARRQGFFISPGAAGMAPGTTGQGGGQVGPWTAAALGLLNNLTFGQAPALQGPLVSLGSLFSDEPLSVQEATRRSEIEQAAAQQAFPDAYQTGRGFASGAAAMLPGGLPLSLAMPVSSAARDAVAGGQDPVSAASKAALLESALLGGGSLAGLVGKGALNLSRNLWSEMGPELKQSLQALAKRTGGEIRFPGSGPPQIADEISQTIPAPGTPTTPAPLSADRAIAPESWMLDPNVLIRSRSEGDISKLMSEYNESVIPNRPMGMRSHLETVPPPGRAPGQRPPQESEIDTLLRPQAQEPPMSVQPESSPQMSGSDESWRRQEEALNRLGTEWFERPQTSTPSAPPTAPPPSRPRPARSVASSGPVQAMERALRSGATFGLWDSSNPMLGLLTGSTLYGKQTPVLTGVVSAALGPAGKFLGSVVPRVSGALAELSGVAHPQRQSERQQEFAQFAIQDPGLRREAETILQNAGSPTQEVAHDVLMQRSPRYRQEYMSWAAKQKR